MLLDINLKRKGSLTRPLGYVTSWAGGVGEGTKVGMQRYVGQEGSRQVGSDHSCRSQDSRKPKTNRIVRASRFPQFLFSITTSVSTFAADGTNTSVQRQF